VGKDCIFFVQFVLNIHQFDNFYIPIIHTNLNIALICISCISLTETKIKMCLVCIINIYSILFNLYKSREGNLYTCLIQINLSMYLLYRIHKSNFLQYFNIILIRIKCIYSILVNLWINLKNILNIKLIQLNFNKILVNIQCNDFSFLHFNISPLDILCISQNQAQVNNALMDSFYNLLN